MSPRPLIFITAMTLCVTSAAFAQSDERKNEDDTLKKAGEIASQPAKDVGITKTKIPVVLLNAQQQPYAPAKPNNCTGLSAGLRELNETLGPDFTTSSRENEDKFGKLAEAGGQAVVNTLIPFRGLVREVSGAAPAERRLNAAINAGLARRGYLRGLAVSRKCKLPA